MGYIKDNDGKRIQSVDNMKILGFHVDGMPTAHAHVVALKKRMKETAWVIRHLGQSGFTEAELATVYRTVVRPILNYCCITYHPIFTDEQNQVL